MKLTDREILLVAMAAELAASYISAYPQREPHEAVGAVINFIRREKQEMEDIEAENPILHKIKELFEVVQ